MPGGATVMTKDVDAVKRATAKAGLTHISILSDALSEPSVCKTAAFEQLVYPAMAARPATR